jgi:hypothetical protein
MSIWEKTILNIEKGSKKVAATAAVFSERVKAELAIIKLRVKISDVQTRIGLLHQAIGVRITDLLKKDTLPKTTEHLLQDEEIATALSKLSKRAGELEGLISDLNDIKSDIESTRKETEEILQ